MNETALMTLSQAGSSAFLDTLAQGKHAPCTKWALSHGAGRRKACWPLAGRLGEAVHCLGTLAILLVFPVIAVYMWHINEHCGGSAARFLAEVLSGGGSYLAASYPRPSWAALRYLLCFGAVQAALLLLLPGRRFRGPVTPRGNVPVYKANGVQAYLCTLALFLGGWRLGAFDPAAVYDAMGSIVSTSNACSLAFCCLLYVKGCLAPSTTDSGTTGSLLQDFFWGMELFPRVGPLDIKALTNCRMGMMSWAVLPLCYLAKQAELQAGGAANSMLVCVALMQLYVFKFFLWETGYFGSLDIAHDRAGFYLCWGCLVWVPSVYTSPAMYLVRRPAALPPAAAAALLALGAACIAINYDSDRQRQRFRLTGPGGRALVWGRPAKKIEAKFTTADGSVKTSLLLASGWWGLARHFHYVPEVAAALCWSAAGGFASVVPFTYVLFLVALLTDRAFRDDARCSAKYGPYWEQYCRLVRYKVIPGVF